MIKYLKNEYKNEFQLYSKYHQNKINWYIHSISIPLEWFSFLLFISNFTLLYWLISFLIFIYYNLLIYNNKKNKKRINIICSLLHLLFSIIIDLIHYYFQNSIYTFNLSFIPFISSLSIKYNYYILILSISLYFISWFLQICIGHFYFEKNYPSMTKKLTFNSIILSVLLSLDH